MSRIYDLNHHISSALEDYESRLMDKINVDNMGTFTYEGVPLTPPEVLDIGLTIVKLETVADYFRNGIGFPIPQGDI